MSGGFFVSAGRISRTRLLWWAVRAAGRGNLSTAMADGRHMFSLPPGEWCPAEQGGWA